MNDSSNGLIELSSLPQVMNISLCTGPKLIRALAEEASLFKSF
uniref:Uncharacterized protein n=1 Tax=Arundo donax TaxID=35708 RepID=A0A0A8ZF61_ARUDO